MSDINRSLSLSKKLFSDDIEKVATRDGYGEGLVEAGKKDERVVVLCADLTDSTRSTLFKREFPDRFIECGVAEQNMMGVAAGMALAGKIPFVSSYAVFSPGRNWDQLRVSVCYSEANVKVAGAHTGVSVGPDGATHQALEDIAITRVLPNLTVLVPCDYEETKKATLAAAQMKGPVYLRFARGKTPVFTTEKTPFAIGKAKVFRPGKDITMVACGPLVYEALEAAESLSHTHRIECEVINCSTIKPLDKTTLLTSVRKTSKVVTIEEHQALGGLGGAVAELLSEELPTPLLKIGMPDQFGESGPPEELWKKYGLDHQSIVVRVQERMV